MGLTNQQKLYGLPDYYLLLMIGDNEVCGIIDEKTMDKIDNDILFDCGFYLEKVNFDMLYSQALTILKEEELIN